MAILYDLIETSLPVVREPGVAFAAVAVAIGGTAAELYQNHDEHGKIKDLKQSMPIANPDRARGVMAKARQNRMLSRVGYYAALGLVSLGLAEASGIYTTDNHNADTTSVVLDANYSGDAQDVNGADGKQTTRLIASIEGGLAAAKNSDQSFSFVVEGSSAHTVDTTSSGSKDLGEAKKRIYDAAGNPTMRLGESLSDGVKQALPSEGDKTNNVVIVASNVNSKDAAGIKAIKTSLKVQYPNDKLRAVVVGDGNGEYKVGTEKQSAVPDHQAFVRLLGAKNVVEAKSSDQVKDAILKFGSEQVTAVKKDRFHGFGYAAIVAGAVLVAVSVRRRIPNPRTLLSAKQRSK